MKRITDRTQWHLSTLEERTAALATIGCNHEQSIVDYRFTPWDALPESIRQELMEVQ